MNASHRTYVRPDVKMYDLICENPHFLLFLQHFDIDFSVDTKTVAQLCKEYSYSQKAFITIANLYNGFYPETENECSIEDLSTLLTFLKNNHYYYLSEKYPELTALLDKLSQDYEGDDIKLIKKFLVEYFNEVREHLNYEDKIVFPYMNCIINKTENLSEDQFVAQVYQDHHTDIESKLNDLRNFFLRYLKVPKHLSLKRKFLTLLNELEFDLLLHSRVEEMILIPLVKQFEKSQNG